MQGKYKNDIGIKTPDPRMIPMSQFDLTHTRQLSFDMGQFVPVMCLEKMPNDRFKIRQDVLVRFLALVAPVMTPIKVHLRVYAVENRNMMTPGLWEDFITGGDKGADATAHPYITLNGTNNAPKTLLDYLGYDTEDTGIANPFPIRAYDQIYNEFVRNQDIQDKLVVSLAAGEDTTTSIVLKNVNWWSGDYLQGALPYPLKYQNGTNITLPLGTSAPVLGIGTDNTGSGTFNVAGVTIRESDGTTSVYTNSQLIGEAAAVRNTYIEGTAASGGYPMIRADLANAIAPTITAVREAFAKMAFYELLAHTGSRLSEFYRNVYGASTSNKSMSRPQLLGGITTPMIISEVLQTSKTDSSPQGNMAGHGISPGRQDNYIDYYSEEHGWIIACLFITPDVVYQKGQDRKFTRASRLDYPVPQLALIGDQSVLNREAYAEHSSPTGIFGYQRRYAEMMTERSRVHGDFLTESGTTLEQWHLAIDLQADPSLNSTFITCTPDLARIFAQVVTNNCLATVYNDVQVIRALPHPDSPYKLD